MKTLYNNTKYYRLFLSLVIVSAVSIFCDNANAQSVQVMTILIPQDEFYANQNEDERIGSIAIAKTNDIFVTGTKHAIVWELNSGKRLLTFEGHGEKNWITSAAISPDGNLICTGAHSLTAKLWDASSGKEIHTFKSCTDVNKKGVYLGGMSGVAFSPDGERIATVDPNGFLQIWDVKTGDELQQFCGLGFLRIVQFFPDGNRVLVQKMSSFFILNLIDGKISHATWGNNSVLTNDGLKIVSNQGNLVQLLEIGNNKMESLFRFPTDDYQVPNSVAISPDGGSVVIGSAMNNDGKKDLFFSKTLYEGFDFSTERALDIQASENGEQKMKADDFVLFSPDGSYFLSAKGRNISIWE